MTPLPPSPNPLPLTRSSTWDKFDVFLRELFEATEFPGCPRRVTFPGGSGTVFDYRLDPAR